MMILESYMELKDNLVNDKFSEAQANVENLQAAVLANTPEGSETILALLEEMSVAESISGLRSTFDPLSEEMYQWAKGIEKGNTTIYWQYCPMAKDNQGANWLSLESEIMNPYFGDQMLHCGNIEEEL
jgi:hypothetical protein